MNQQLFFYNLLNLTLMKDRIKQFIDHKHLSVREFERNCGISNGLIKNMERSFGKKDKIFKTKTDKKSQRRKNIIKDNNLQTTDNMTYKTQSDTMR